MGRGDPVSEVDAWWTHHPPSHPFGTCQCGCGAFTDLATKGHRGKGWVAGAPRQYLKGHHTRLSGNDWIVDESGCWIWQLSRNREGYGLHNKPEGGTIMAHRWVYQRLVEPIPEGLNLDHLCRVRACVNPSHLEPVTHAENVRRGIAAHGGKWGVALRVGSEG